MVAPLFLLGMLPDMMSMFGDFGGGGGGFVQPQYGYYGYQPQPYVYSQSYVAPEYYYSYPQYGYQQYGYQPGVTGGYQYGTHLDRPGARRGAAVHTGSSYHRSANAHAPRERRINK